MSDKKNTNDNSIKSFTDLRSWQEGHQFVIALYKDTKQFPDEEKFGLTSQLRRVAVSITSNIAEGFSRSGGREKKSFYATSLGSLTEVQNQLLLSRDLGYISNDAFQKRAEQSVGIAKMIQGLIKTAGSRSNSRDTKAPFMPS